MAQILMVMYRDKEFIKADFLNGNVAVSPADEGLDGLLDEIKQFVNRMGWGVVTQWQTLP